MQNKFKDNKRDFLKFAVFLVVIAALTVITIRLFPWVLSLKDEAGREAFRQYIHSRGAWGVLILLGIQILQVIVALIPGEPVEVIAGLLYGSWGGYFLCTAGMLAGTVLIYYMMKLLGVTFLRRLIGEKKLEKYKFMHNTRKLGMVTFLLFFIPGTPKDLLTYFMPLTKMKPLTFFVIVLTARMPSIFSSTLAGASIGEGNWSKTVLIFAIIGGLAILGILFNDALMKQLNKGRERYKGRKKQ